MTSIFDLRFLLLCCGHTRELFRLLKIMYIFIVGRENVKNSDSVLNIRAGIFRQQPQSLFHFLEVNRLVRLPLYLLICVVYEDDYKQ